MKKFLLLCVVALLAACTDAPRSTPEDNEMQLILVTGVTGTQGGAVARELLSRGYAVRGLSRNPASQAGSAMSERGVEMMRGNFDDADSLAAAMAGVYGVFAVTDFWEHGYGTEVRHGQQLVDAAKKAGVKHFVYTSVAGADDSTGIPHFDSKAEVESYLYASGLDYSVVRPVEFMDNLRYRLDSIRSGTFFDPRNPDARHQWIAASDIGYFVGEAFDNPDHWLGRTTEIAGDEMSIAEFMQALSKASGRDVRHEQVPWDTFEAQAGQEMTLMLRWFEADGYQVDIVALRAQYPSLSTLDEYLVSLPWD